MSKIKSAKRELIEWGIIIAVGLALYLTGYHVVVIGKLQQLLLYTGIRQPKLIEAGKRQEKITYNWLIEDENGNRIPVSQYRGKVIFINFWATDSAR